LIFSLVVLRLIGPVCYILYDDDDDDFLSVKGLTLKFEDILDRNAQRDNFCSKYVGYGEFCASELMISCLEYFKKFV